MKTNVKMNTTSLAQQLRTSQNHLDALRKKRDNRINRNAPNEELVELEARINEIARKANALKKMSNSSNQQQQQMATSSFSRTQPQEEAVSSGVNATNTNPFATKALSSANENEQATKRQRGDLNGNWIGTSYSQSTKQSIVGSTAGFKTDDEDGPPPLADFKGRVVQPMKTSTAGFPPLASKPPPKNDRDAAAERRREHAVHPRPHQATIAGHAAQPASLDAIAGGDRNARKEASRARKAKRKRSADGSTKQPPPQPAAGLKTESDDPTMMSGEL